MPACPPPLSRLLQRVQDAWQLARTHLAQNLEAERGAALLTSLLERVWYAPGAAGSVAAPPAAGTAGASTSAAGAGAPGAGGPLFLPELEAALARCRGAFDPLVAFARAATSLELRANEAAYAPFLAGCGPGYGAASMAELCARRVERMGEEVEQLQMAALASALGVGVGVLDVAGSEVGMVRHPSGGGEPLFYLLHLPGALAFGGGGAGV